MKKTLLILLILTITFSHGCKPKFWPDKEKSATEKAGKKEPGEKEIIPDPSTPTTGKTFTPSPEGIRHVKTWRAKFDNSIL